MFVYKYVYVKTTGAPWCGPGRDVDLHHPTTRRRKPVESAWRSPIRIGWPCSRMRRPTRNQKQYPQDGKLWWLPYTLWPLHPYCPMILHVSGVTWSHVCHRVPSDPVRKTGHVLTTEIWNHIGILTLVNYNRNDHTRPNTINDQWFNGLYKTWYSKKIYLLSHENSLFKGIKESKH